MLNNKKLAILIIVFSVGLIISVIGCNNTGNPTSAAITTGNSLTPAITATTTDAYQSSRAREIAARTIEACSGVTTLKMDVSISHLESRIEEPPTGFQSFIVARTEMNRTEKQFKLFESSIYKSFSSKYDRDNEWSSSTNYWSDGWYYYKYKEGYPSGKTYWVKEESETNSYWINWSNYDYLFQQVEYLRTATDMTYSGSEMIDGVLCDIIQVEQDLEMVSDWLDHNAASHRLADKDLSELPKIFQLKEWISHDSYMPVKFEMFLYIEIFPDDLKKYYYYSPNLEKVIIGIVESGKFYDYGQPVDTVLPPEAESAKEIYIIRDLVFN